MAAADLQTAISYIALLTLDGDDQQARLVQRVPRTDRPHMPFPPGITAFALDRMRSASQPSASSVSTVRSAAHPPPEEREHTAVLTLADGSRVYAAYLMLSRPAAQVDAHTTPLAVQVLCLVSHRPLLCQMQAAANALRIAMSRGPVETSQIVRALLHLPCPLPGIELRVCLGNASKPLALRAHPLGMPPALGVRLQDFVRRIGPELAIRTIEVLVSELRLVVVSRSEHCLGESAESLLGMLHPLEWPHTYIPLLPTAWRPYVEAPCPFLIGLVEHCNSLGAASTGDQSCNSIGAHSSASRFDIHASPIATQLPEDVCVLDLDAVTLTVPEDEPYMPFPARERDHLAAELNKWVNIRSNSTGDSDDDRRPNDELNLLGQQIWVHHWRRFLGGYSTFSSDTGADVDAPAMLANAATAHRPFLERLLSSAPFLRYLDRVAMGEAFDELRNTMEPANDSAPAQGAQEAAVDKLAGESADHLESQKTSNLPNITVIQLPRNLLNPHRTSTLSPETSAAVTPPSHLALPPPPPTETTQVSQQYSLGLDNAGVGGGSSMPCSVDEPIRGLLPLMQELAHASPSCLPLQLMLAREQLRHEAPMDALLTLQSAQERWSRIGEGRQQRHSSRSRLTTQLTSSSIGSDGAPQPPSAVARLHEPCAGLEQNCARIAGRSGSRRASAPDPTLLALVSSCLSCLDARKLAELATLRSTPSTSRAASVEAKCSQPQSTRDVDKDSSSSLSSVSARSTIRSHTLRESAAIAAAARAGALLPVAGTPHSSRYFASRPASASPLSPQRPPLLAAWARAHLDSQARQHESHYRSEESTTEIDVPDADPFGHQKSDHETLREHSVSAATLGTRSLAATTNAREADGPPSEWGLAIPWLWRGNDHAGDAVEVDPVQLFRRLCKINARNTHGEQGRHIGAASECRGSTSKEDVSGCAHEERADENVVAGLQERLDSMHAAHNQCAGSATAADAAAAPNGVQEATHKADDAIEKSDFERFGGELLQVAGAPELSKLWDSLMRMQQCDLAMLEQQRTTATPRSPPLSSCISSLRSFGTLHSGSGRIRTCAQQPTSALVEASAPTPASDPIPSSTIACMGPEDPSRPPAVDVPAVPTSSHKCTDDSKDAAPVLCDAPPCESLRLSIFEAWHKQLRSTMHPTPSWRRQLGLEARELLIQRSHGPCVRDQPFGVPGILVLTSDRLIFGNVNFQTAASLPALRTIRTSSGLVGEALLTITVDGPGAVPVVLRFGRGSAARTQRDIWAKSLEVMRRAYVHGWALASNVPIAQAAHCVACAAALSNPSEGAPLLHLLSAQPPRNVSRYYDDGGQSHRWRVLRLSGDCCTAPELRVACIAAAGSGLAVGSHGGTIRLFRVAEESNNNKTHDEGPMSPSRGVEEFQCKQVIPDGAHGSSASTVPCQIPLDPPTPEAQCGKHASFVDVHDQTDDPANLGKLSPTISRVSSSPRLPVHSNLSASRSRGRRLVTKELARAQGAETPVMMAFASVANATARLLSLSGGTVQVWRSRLQSSRPLPLPVGHSATRFAVMLHRPESGLVAVASEAATERHRSRAINVMRLVTTNTGSTTATDAAKEVRRLVLPLPILALAFCGDSNLCVAHHNEYVLICISTGTVHELFRFEADYGAPFLQRLSDLELLVVQPPPRAGERQVGLFLDCNGNTARRSTVHWRQPPIDCATRRGALITLLPNTIEVHQLSSETSQITLPFADALCMANGGHHPIVATDDAVFALLGPEAGKATISKS